MNRTRILTKSAVAIVLVSSLANAQGRGRGRGHDDKRQVSPQEQQQRVEEQRQRDAAYQAMLNTQMRVAQQNEALLQQQKRAAQYELQRQYVANLREQHQRLQVQREVSRDPYYAAPVSYRYAVGGTYHETNQYGADMLRQAVNYGYQQGEQAGQADRRDRWPSNYRKSYAYQDANYGYNANYIPQSDYNYYFREGFRRGYDDGYASRSQYGTVVNGSPSILSSILSGILGLQGIP